MGLYWIVPFPIVPEVFAGHTDNAQLIINLCSITAEFRDQNHTIVFQLPLTNNLGIHAISAEKGDHDPANI